MIYSIVVNENETVVECFSTWKTSKQLIYVPKTKSKTEGVAILLATAYISPDDTGNYIHEVYYVTYAYQS